MSFSFDGHSWEVLFARSRIVGLDCRVAWGFGEPADCDMRVYVIRGERTVLTRFVHWGIVLFSVQFVLHCNISVMLISHVFVHGCCSHNFIAVMCTQ